MNIEHAAYIVQQKSGRAFTHSVSIPCFYNLYSYAKMFPWTLGTAENAERRKREFKGSTSRPKKNFRRTGGYKEAVVKGCKYKFVLLCVHYSN